MMLLDYNGVAIGNIVTQKLEIHEDLIRHMILNSIRLYNKKFRKEFGEMVICADAGGNWRKKVYPEYKAGRATSRESDPEYWNSIFEIINKVREEIVEHTPYKMIQIWGCEADDIIATLCEYTQEFGKYEPVMILSADKDFAQLQKWKNIKQFSTMTKKHIVEPDPDKFLFEHVCRGDGSDGVPNVLSDDDTFVADKRQTPLRQSQIDEWHNSRNLHQLGMDSTTYRNFQRNQKVIDLSFTPEDLKREIINTYESQEKTPGSKLLPYLISKRCRKLIEDIGDFL